MKKTILLMFAAVISIATICSADESAPKENASVPTNAAETTAAEKQDAVSDSIAAQKAETNGQVASKVDAEDNKTAKKSTKPRSLTRQDIRNMPLLERPNRPGHFHGNTVRRLHSR